MLTIQTFFAMFNFFQKPVDKKAYAEILDEFNHDVYGFSNDQAYRNLSTSFSEPVKVSSARMMMGNEMGLLREA